MDLTGSASWVSSNPAVATISASGLGRGNEHEHPNTDQRQQDDHAEHVCGRRLVVEDEDLVAEAVVRADPLAEDRAEHRERRAHFEAGEDKR